MPRPVPSSEPGALATDGGGCDAAVAGAGTPGPRGDRRTGSDDGLAKGTEIAVPHLGHFVFFPAALPSTWNPWQQWGQANRIIEYLSVGRPFRAGR